MVLQKLIFMTVTLYMPIIHNQRLESKIDLNCLPSMDFPAWITFNN